MVKRKIFGLKVLKKSEVGTDIITIVLNVLKSKKIYSCADAEIEAPRNKLRGTK
jgi:hypothetical protein